MKAQDEDCNLDADVVYGNVMRQGKARGGAGWDGNGRPESSTHNNRPCLLSWRPRRCCPQRRRMRTASVAACVSRGLSAAVVRAEALGEDARRGCQGTRTD